MCLIGTFWLVLYSCWFVAWCQQMHRDALYICLIGTFWLALCGLLVCGMLLADALEIIYLFDCYTYMII